MTTDAMMELIKGYQSFRRDQYANEAERYETLAEKGQTPRSLIIGCCDSRVDPSRIFNAGPGELFVVRNVANLVPPCEEHGSYHGTSAAVEFAVRHLGVAQIVVMGHARCGGVQAFLQTANDTASSQSFIGNWISLLRPAYTQAAEAGIPTAPETRQRWMEHAAIKGSLRNLMTFPFVKDAVEAGRLRLQGAFFDIATGELQILDPDTGTFSLVAARQS